MSDQFQHWVIEHQDAVWSLARYLLQDAAEAEDVTQDTYIKLWNQRDRLESAAVKPWLLKVCRNACLDRLRRLKLVPADAPDEGPDPSENLERDQMAEKLKNAVRELREPYRSLIVLRDIQQLSYADVAAVTELSMAQVKTYLHRARKSLREALA